MHQQTETVPKKKKGKKVGLIILAVLIIILIFAGITVNEKRKAAASICAFLEKKAFVYSAEVDLPLAQDKAALLQSYLDFEKAALYHFSVSGTFQGDRLTAEIFAEGDTEGLTDIVNENGEFLMNIGRMYRIARVRRIAAEPVMALLLPEWSWGDYLDKEQMDALFGIDMKALPDIGGLWDQVNSYASVPALTGGLLLADKHKKTDGWDTYLFHLTSGDSRLDTIKNLTKLDISLPEGLDADVTFCVGKEQHVRIEIDGTSFPNSGVQNYHVVLTDDPVPGPKKAEKIDDETFAAIRTLIGIMK